MSAQVLKDPASGTFGGLISLVGYEAYPEATYRERSVWLKLALRSETRVRRPLVLTITLAHASGMVRDWTLPTSALVNYERLEPGRYFTAETFITIPSDWPAGDSGLYVGIDDKRSRKPLDITQAAPGQGKSEHGVRLRTLRVLE